MEHSELIDAARQFGVEIEASLFEQENTEPELEVYFQVLRSVVLVLILL
jgi:hypothetical protein